MSIREYAVNSYGLVLTEEEVKEFGKKYMRINDQKRYVDEDWDNASAWDCIDNVNLIIYFSEFTGEALKITSNGKDDWDNSTVYDNDNCFVIELNNWPSLFRQAYESYADLITKLRKAYKEYLPSDFNYETHLRHVFGTVWC